MHLEDLFFKNLYRRDPELRRFLCIYLFYSFEIKEEILKQIPVFTITEKNSLSE